MPSGEYNPQLTKGGLLSFPLASVTTNLSDLTDRVNKNNRFATPLTAGPNISAVRQGIQHVSYILKENRTYDQILGDLGRGNGDPSLTLCGQSITPNQPWRTRESGPRNRPKTDLNRRVARDITSPAARDRSTAVNTDVIHSPRVPALIHGKTARWHCCQICMFRMGFSMENRPTR